MSDRKQKSLEKKKARRAKKQKTRRVRNQAASTSTGTPLKTMLGWNLGDAWVGQDWHEQGARIPVVVTRAHPGGGIAAAIFDLDLSGGGVIRAGVAGPLQENELNDRLAKISEAAPMVQVGPGHALACVAAAEALTDELPQGWSDARAMFGDLELDASIEILTGTPPEPEKKKGLFGRLFG